MTNQIHRPRLNVEITLEQYKRLYDMLEYGERKALFQRLVDTVINTYDEHGKMAIYALVLGKVSIIDIMRKREEVSKDDNN